ncbi:MAG: ABC transporter permease subunit [Verrucomicrobiota bacterium]
MIETWRDLVLAPSGARGEVSPPAIARALNSLLALLVLIGIVWFSLASLRLDWMSVWKYRVVLAEGWLTTLEVTGVALVVSVVTGFVLALFQRSYLLPVRYLARFFVETVRCIPLLALIYLVWYGIEGAAGIGNEVPAGLGHPRALAFRERLHQRDLPRGHRGRRQVAARVGARHRLHPHADPTATSSSRRPSARCCRRSSAARVADQGLVAALDHRHPGIHAERAADGEHHLRQPGDLLRRGTGLPRAHRADLALVALARAPVQI